MVESASSSSSSSSSVRSEVRRAAAWNRVMGATPGTLDLRVAATAITGTVPEALRGGRLLSNGPGWSVFGDWKAHPFDGHGYVRAFAFDDDGAVSVRGRYVETAVYREERAAGRMVRRGFASNVGPHFWQNLGFRTPRNVANTTIIRRGDTLLAGWEGGAPYALHAETLETIGEETFGGVIAAQATLAHMHADAQRDRLILCSVKNGPTATFRFRELDSTNVVVATYEAAIAGPLFAHDFAHTANSVIVARNPLRMRPRELLKLVAGSSTLLRCLETKLDEPGALCVIARGGGPTRFVTLPDTAFVVHFGNAFERADGTIVVDVCAFTRFEFGEEFGFAGPQAPYDPTLPDKRGPQRLYRVEIPAGATEASWRLLAPFGVDFPRVHPRGEGQDVPVLFGACRADDRFSDPFDSIIRVDLRAAADDDRASTVWTAGDETVFVGEPVFVPTDADPGCTDGHVLVVVSDGERGLSRLVVLDATDIAAGPVADVPLPLLPAAFHGDWDPRR